MIPFSGFSQQHQVTQNTKTALILIDIQNDYFEKGTMTLVGSDIASNNAKLILESFRADNLPIIHIQHIAKGPTATFFLPNTKGAEIHDNVKPLAQEKVIIKHYPNSFRETELLDYLKSKGITDLVICGMMTHMCVDATTRAAKDFGFNITLIGDACATKDLEINGQSVKAEEVQKSFLAALNYSYSTVSTTQQYLGQNKRGTQPAR
jgi:nicotinamidase-related amidase